jgi:DNA end-binding protein Ku
MAPRAYWKGYLKLSLVSCPVALFPATSEREKISFHQLNKNTGNRTIEIDEFVPRKEIDELYQNNPYYIVPDGEVGEQAFAVIREAIRQEGMVAIGKVVFTSREHIIALEARGKGMMGMTLRYPYEVRKEDEYFDDIADEKIPKDMLELATHIVQ